MRTALAALLVLFLAGCDLEPPKPSGDSAKRSPSAATSADRTPETEKPQVVHLTSDNFQKLVLASRKPVLVDFTAKWCGPCQFMVPIVEQLAEEYHGRAVIGKLDIDQAEALATEYGAPPIPLFLVFKDGKPVGKKLGSGPIRELRTLIDQAL